MFCCRYSKVKFLVPSAITYATPLEPNINFSSRFDYLARQESKWSFELDDLQRGTTGLGSTTQEIWPDKMQRSLRVCLDPSKNPQNPNFTSHLHHIETLTITNDSCIEY